MHSNRLGCPTLLARAGSGIETSSLRSSVGKGNSPGFTEPTLPRKRSGQVSARFRPRTSWEVRHGPDSPALHPLHSSRSSPAFRRNSIGSMPGLRFFVPTAANSRDSQNSSCAPGKARHQRPRGFATAGTGNSPRCFARARHRNTARGSACRRGQAIGREASPGPVGAGSACH